MHSFITKNNTEACHEFTPEVEGVRNIGSRLRMLVLDAPRGRGIDKTNMASGSGLAQFARVLVYMPPAGEESNRNRKTNMASGSRPIQFGRVPV